MAANIEITHAPGKVTFTITVNGKRARISVTPERARAIALEIMTGKSGADFPGPADPSKSMLDQLLDLLRGIRGDADL